jgi:hypothetical protein
MRSVDSNTQESEKAAKQFTAASMPQIEECLGGLRVDCCCFSSPASNMDSSVTVGHVSNDKSQSERTLQSRKSNVREKGTGGATTKTEVN